MNNKGPKKDPCGTPEDMGNKDDAQPSITVLCCLFVKYDLNQQSNLPLTPTFDKSFSKQLNETESNALL